MTSCQSRLTSGSDDQSFGAIDTQNGDIPIRDIYTTDDLSKNVGEFVNIEPSEEVIVFEDCESVTGIQIPTKGKKSFKIQGIRSFLQIYDLESYRLLVVNEDGDVIFNEKDSTSASDLERSEYLVFFSSEAITDCKKIDPADLKIKFK